jgi:hypothetical protein
MASCNGVAPRPEKLFATISAAVLKTLAYADLFDHPLHSEEVHDGLFDCGASLHEVKTALRDWERGGVIEQRQQFYFIRGRGQIVAVREQRRQQAQRLLRQNAWPLRLIINFPFVRSVALSGANAFENCKKADDIDVFILTAPRRLWSVHVALVILFKLWRKRRTICLNCLFDLDHLGVEDGDFFIAHQIAFLRPLSGGEYLQKFQAANNWIYSHLPQRRCATATTRLVQPQFVEHIRFKRVIEKICSWRIFDYLERLAFAAYRRHIQRKIMHLQGYDVVMQPGRIKLFTNNHRQRVKDMLDRRLQQILPNDFSRQKVGERHVVF